MKACGKKKVSQAPPRGSSLKGDAVMMLSREQKKKRVRIANHSLLVDRMDVNKLREPKFKKTFTGRNFRNSQWGWEDCHEQDCEPAAFNAQLHAFAEAELIRGHLLARANTLKSLRSICSEEPVGLRALCTSCGESLLNRECLHCAQRCMKCIVCHIPLTGRAIHCVICGHGGHIEHMKNWFRFQIQCPTGCGCRCPEMNGLIL